MGAASFALCPHLASLFMLPILTSTSQPLYHNMFVSHLSITSIPSIFICVASHSFSQSIFLPCKCSCCLPVNLLLSVSISFFVVFLCVPSFFWPCEKLLTVFVVCPNHLHGDQLWVTAPKKVPSLQGPWKGKRNVRVLRGRVCGCIIHASIY